jgi:hypothetical protein
MWSLPTWLARLVVASIALSGLCGCVGIPAGTSPPASFPKEEKIEALIGSTSDEVRAELGSPHFTFKSEDKRYFVYQGWGAEHGLILIVYVPVDAWTREGEVLYCLVLEFDAQDRLQRAETKSHMGFWTVKRDCRELFPDSGGD